MVSSNSTHTVKKVFLFSSDPEAGASNLSVKGDSFHVDLNTPLVIPEGAYSARLSVLDSSIWNTVPNIASFYNNNILNVNAIPTIIPDGLYSLDDLNATLARQLDLNGLSKTAVIFEADNATQKVVMVLEAGITVDFTPSDFNEVVGFDSITYNSAVNFAPSVANFNRIEFFIIECSEVLNGISLNNINSGIIHKHIISAGTGSQSNYSPFNPQPVNISNLIGQKTGKFSFRLRDQLNRVVDTNNETYAFTVLIEYDIEVPVNQHHERQVHSMPHRY
jgi:hypothetical protein